MKRVQVIDSHTGGEPTRVVIAGGPDLGTGPLAGRLQRFREHHDRFRSAVVNEPRGSDVMVGALLCAPVDPTCAAGVIFFNNVGYLGMCGHGTIGLVATLAHLGRIAPGEHRIETPVGTVKATLHADGTVAVENVPSHRQAKAVAVEVPNLGSVTGDVAWAGNWFYLVENHGQEVALANVERLTDIAWRIRQAVNAQGFPDVDHVELFGPPTTPGARSKNFVLCPGKAYDRSPCGTGTSAKLACLAADGKLAEGESWVQESILGSTFTARFRWLDQPRGVIQPTIAGTAFVNAEATLLLDDRDPFCWGIGARVSDRRETPATDDASPAPVGHLRSFNGSAEVNSAPGAGVRELVATKRKWHSPPPSAGERAQGFAGWHSRGYLPHFDRAGLCQFVTFRLADALPAARRSEWMSILRIEDEHQRIASLERYVDAGHGQCVLRDPAAAEIVQSALLRFDGERYRLLGWVVMPNHVHVLVEILAVPLARLLHTWKAYTSLQINRRLDRTGRLWQPEYFDRYMRDEEHFRKTLRYIETNPVRAGLAREPGDWPWSSARFRNPAADRSAGVHPAKRLAELNDQRRLDTGAPDRSAEVHSADPAPVGHLRS